MGTITGKFHQNPLKTVGGVAETRFTAQKLLKGHNSGKNQSSMTSIKYAHFQVIGTISGKFYKKNPLETVGGVAETKLCLRTDGLTDEPITIVPFDLRQRATSKITKEPNQKSLLGTASNDITGGLQLVCGLPTLAFSSALVPQTLICLVCVEDS